MTCGAFRVCIRSTRGWRRLLGRTVLGPGFHHIDGSLVRVRIQD